MDVAKQQAWSQQKFDCSQLPILNKSLQVGARIPDTNASPMKQILTLVLHERESSMNNLNMKTSNAVDRNKELEDNKSLLNELKQF